MVDLTQRREDADRLRSFGADLNFAPWREILMQVASELVVEPENLGDAGANSALLVA